jgi:DNA recombination protein RmuC
MLAVTSGSAVLLLLGLALGAAVGGAIGCAIGWMIGGGRARTRGLVLLGAAEGEARAQRAAVDELRRQVTTALERERTLDEQLADAERARAVAETQTTELRVRLDEERELLAEAEVRLGDTFRSLAAEALSANNQGFMALATEKLQGARIENEAALDARTRAIEGLVNPVKESLDRVDSKIQDMERERGQAYGRLMEQVQGLMTSNDRLQTETGNLARALRSPSVRGRWGEIQLRRAVELAGMLEHCDFSQQVTLVGQESERRLRPDLVVRMPGGRHVVVDAKVPLEGYLQAMEATSEDDRRARLREHGCQVRAHMTKLSSKTYWAELPCAPEFVVMFLPGESIFGAALEDSPGLLEEGVGRKVLLATPTTLIALLQTVHYGWRQERLTENAEKISEQGRQLHERVVTLVEHWVRLGHSLGKATEHFNAAAASFEGRVLPAVRRLEEMGAGSKKSLGELPRLDIRPREASAHVIEEGAGGSLAMFEMAK